MIKNTISKEILQEMDKFNHELVAVLGNFYLYLKDKGMSHDVAEEVLATTSKVIINSMNNPEVMKAYRNGDKKVRVSLNDKS